MLSNKTLRNIPEYSRAYKTNLPFNHIVMDDFFRDDTIEKLLDEVEFIASNPSELWRFVGGGDDYDKHDDQINKKQIYSFENMLPTMQEVIKYLNSKQFLKIVSEITGLKNLSNESETYTNAAYHQTSKDGRLEIHHDFNDSYINPNLFRQVNLLVYLNLNWIKEWGGNLELWNKNLTEKTHEIAPMFNRAVIFNITDNAYHGHPEPLNCPDNEARYSMALYYFTEDRPEEENQTRPSALWFFPEQ